MLMALSPNSADGGEEAWERGGEKGWEGQKEGVGVRTKSVHLFLEETG